MHTHTKLLNSTQTSHFPCSFGQWRQ